MANPAIERLSQDYGRGDWARTSSNGKTVTIDSVVQKTAISLIVLVITAAITWMFAQSAVEANSQTAFSQIATFAFVASMAALGLSLFISFKRVTSPPLILLFSAIEGVVIGFYSKVAALYAGSNEVVVGAVIGTFAATAATLAVYKFFDIQVTNKMRRWVTIAAFAFVGVSLLDLALHFFGNSIGVNGFGAMGALFSLVGIGIALFMLITDFDAIERSVEYGLPDRESWRLAFGLTVTLVWIYINMLKILTYLRGGD